MRDLFYSYRNKLYAKAVGWVIRMFAECELFLLLSIDEEGNTTVRALEPDRIGNATDSGLITDPDDVTQTVFYKYSTSTDEFIPDARWIIEPDYMKERMKILGDKVDQKLINPITKGKGGKYNKIGGYRRFILHWKNLTGIHEYKRDTASLSTVIEWINLLIKHIRWESDHKRALSAYTWEIKFSDEPAGKVSWTMWNKMTPTEKDATNLTKPLSPGSRVFMMPGMGLKVYNPQIPSMSGSNQDLFNISGASARTPQDLFQGQTAGSTYASIKSTRPPLVAEIENIQNKFENFLRYEFLRVCFAAKLAMGGSLVSPKGKKYKLPETYEVQWPTKIVKGKATFKKIDKELCEAAKFTFPSVQLDANPQERANMSLGSKHTGLQGIGVSNETIAKLLGVSDLSRERKRKILEEMEYGESISGAEAEKGIEEEFKENKSESGADDGAS